MSFTPSHKIYASDGVSLLYTFEYIVERNPILSVVDSDFIEYTNLRSKGSIIVPSGSKPYDITLTGVLKEDNYTDLMTAFSALKTAIASKTKYYLKIDTSISTTEDIKVMRLSPITVDSARGNLTNYLYYTVTFRANCWS